MKGIFNKKEGDGVLELEPKEVNYKIEVVQQGFIVTKNEFHLNESKAVYFDLDMLIRDLKVDLSRYKFGKNRND